MRGVCVIMTISLVVILSSCRNNKADVPVSNNVNVEDVYTFADSCYRNKEYESAVMWRSKAAVRGHVPSQNRLGECYYWGEGVKQNYGQAVYWWKQAAERGLADAQVYLGCCYEEGHGVTQDYGKAAYWYGKAAEQNDPAGLKNLGKLYKNGHGVERDYSKALELLGKSGHKRPDLSRAYNMVARVFNLDNGNYPGAIYWYTKTAEADNPHGQYMLGRLYYLWARL